jgi:uroporphyrinogen decarboxylase
MNKRDAVLSLLDNSKKPEYTPAAFFLHFDPACHRGQAAVDKHLAYFRYTGMDFVKIQFEIDHPRAVEIQRPEDWAKMPFYKKDFYEGPLGVVAGLVKAARKDALVIMTLYSPFMEAAHFTSGELVTRHIQENPQQVKRGMQIITESLMIFVKECIKLGIDGFYTSTQGGENGRLGDKALFDECIRPYDLALMNEVNRTCVFNILHICDYHLPYTELTPFLDYPGHVVNCSLELANRKISAREVAGMFGRPYMGGMERKGVIASGSQAEVRQAAEAALQEAPERFILAADCTVPGNTPWDNLKTAIDAAHTFTRKS